MIKIDIKPLSVNDAWKGRRYKTKEYLTYEKSVLFLLPKILIPLKPYSIHFEFHFSNAASDVDNPLKPILDIIQKKYQINDKDIFKLKAEKKIVKQGEECILFKIENYQQ